MQNGAEERIFDGPAPMDRDNSHRFGRSVDQDQVASFLTVFNESGAL